MDDRIDIKMMSYYVGQIYNFVADKLIPSLLRNLN